ncbi:hypothetical protein LCGC14_1772810 [marine sediment metagenome]|uniref:Uncharacterized protein n=1 Tax=marine sediment metagenome TaxID=412755 RepID=A0A0F9JXE5_9ZZZZ
MSKQFKCPGCGEEVNEYPALSRKDNKNEICSKCGVREAISIFKDYNKST